MKIVEMVGRLGFVLSIVAFIITGSIIASIASFGLASFNVGILVGKRNWKS